MTNGPTKQCGSRAEFRFSGLFFSKAQLGAIEFNLAQVSGLPVKDAETGRHGDAEWDTLTHDTMFENRLRVATRPAKTMCFFFIISANGTRDRRSTVVL